MSVTHLRCLLAKAASRLGWRKVVLLEKELESVSPGMRHGGKSRSTCFGSRTTIQSRAAGPEDYEIERLSTGDLGAYCTFRGAVDIESLQARFDRGDLCFAARHQGRIASVSWISPTVACISYLRATLPIRPGEAYMYDSYTGSEFRRRGLSQRIRSELLRFCKQEGYSTVKVCVAPYTLANLALLGTLRFTTLGTIRSIGVGRCRCIWFSKGGTTVEVSTAERLSQFL